MGLKTTIRRYLSPRAYLRRLVKRRSGLQVLAGPFAGMKYVTEARGAAYLPKLVGCYERELYGVIEGVIAGDHDLLVDVGSAEGYFAVGLATRCETPVVAFEMDPRARDLMEAVAQRNGVGSRIEQRGECREGDLELTLSAAERPFVLMDVEGFEAKLLDMTQAPSLARASVLVEIHEFARPGVTADLLHRFSATHDTRVLWEDDRTADEFPYTSLATRLMPKKYLRRAVEEQRGHKQSWLWMTPRQPETAAAA